MFRTRQRLTQVRKTCDMSVPFFGQALVPVASVKCLGIVLNSHWNFNEHFTCLTSSLLSPFCQISGVRYLLSSPVQILNSLVLTKLLCSPFLGWYHEAKPKKAAAGVKLCCSSCDQHQKLDHLTPVLRELQWPSVSRKYGMSAFLYYIIICLAPACQASNIGKRSDAHNYSTRHKDQLQFSL